jgi:hypothetical protein
VRFIGIVAALFCTALLAIKIIRKSRVSLLFVAPRGLITILLFFINRSLVLFRVNKSLIIQVILLTAVIMMMGLMVTAKRQEASLEKRKNREKAMKERKL